MIARFGRILLAAFFLLNALFSSAVAEGLDCGEAERGSEMSHDHGHRSTHQPHQNARGGDEPDAGGGAAHEMIGCHGAGAGCPGCIGPMTETSATSSENRVAYALSDDVGRSIGLANSFRPPITSL